MANNSVFVGLNDIEHTALNDEALNNELSYKAINCTPSTLMRTPTEGFFRLFGELFTKNVVNIEATIEDDNLVISNLKAFIPVIGYKGLVYFELLKDLTILNNKFDTVDTIYYIYISFIYYENNTITGEYPLDYIKIDLVNDLTNYDDTYSIKIGNITKGANGNLTNWRPTVFISNYKKAFLYSSGMDKEAVSGGIEEDTNLLDLGNSRLYISTININRTTNIALVDTNLLEIETEGYYTIETKFYATITNNNDHTTNGALADFRIIRNLDVITSKELHRNRVPSLEASSSADIEFNARTNAYFNKGDKLYFKYIVSTDDISSDDQVNLKLSNRAYEIIVRKDI